MRLVEPMEGYEYDSDEYSPLLDQTEETVQIRKPQVEYSELDDVFSEELDDLDVREFFIEKKKPTNSRECQVTTSSLIVQPEQTETQPTPTTLSAISVRPFMELSP